MGKFVVLDHPLIQHKLTIIRRKDTGSNEFRRIVGEIGGLMTYEITRDLPLEDVEIETPMGKTVQKEIAGKKLTIVPIYVLVSGCLMVFLIWYHQLKLRSSACIVMKKL